MPRNLFFLILLLSLEPLQAQTAELELTMDFASIGNGVIPGQTRDFSITITNHGPDDANPSNSGFFFVSTLAVGSNDDWVPDLWIELDGSNSPSDCHFLWSRADPLPNQNPNYAYAFLFFQLGAGESITCQGQYTPYFTEGSRTVTWIMSNQLANDPDLSNNEITVTFPLRPTQVPFNNLWSLLLMAALLMGIGSIQIRVKKLK